MEPIELELVGLEYGVRKHEMSRMQFVIFEQVFTELLRCKALCQFLDRDLSINGGFFEQVCELLDFDMMKAHLHFYRRVVIHVLWLFSVVCAAPHFFYIFIIKNHSDTECIVS